MENTESFQDYDESDVITTSDLTDIATRAGNQAANRTRDLIESENAGQTDDMLEEYEPSAKEKVTEMITELKKRQELDIFEDVGEELAKVGHFVTYQIKKEGAMLATVKHPYSWDKIRKEYGEGRYSITAKTMDNVYIKTQTETVILPKNFHVENEDNSKSGNTNLSTVDYFAMMEKQSKQATIEADRRADRDRENLMTMITALKPQKDDSTKEMMALMQSKSSETMQLMLTMLTTLKPEPVKDNSTDMLKFMVDLQNQQQERTERMMEKMQENTNRLLETISTATNVKEEPEFSAMKVMEMVETARNGGFEQYSMINQIAETIAEKNKDSGTGEKDSLTDTLIKSFAPAMGQMMVAKGQGGAPTNQVRPQQRRTLPPQNVRAAGTTSTAQANRKTNTKTTTDPRTSTAFQQETNGQGGGNSSHIRTSVKKGPSGLPSVEDFIETPLTQTETVENTATVETNPNSATMVNIEHKEAIMSNAVPVILESFTNGLSITDAVTHTINAFKQKGIILGRVHIDFTMSDIDEIINGYGLDADTSLMLKEYYVELTESIKSLGESSTN